MGWKVATSTMCKFSIIASLLHSKLLTLGAPFVWPEDCGAIFLKLAQALTSSPAPSHLDDSAPATLHTDTSGWCSAPATHCILFGASGCTRQPRKTALHLSKATLLLFRPLTSSGHTCTDQGVGMKRKPETKNEKRSLWLQRKRNDIYYFVQE